MYIHSSIDDRTPHSARIAGTLLVGIFYALFFVTLLLVVGAGDARAQTATTTATATYGTTSITISNVAATTTTASSTRITWNTDRAATTEVSYGTTTAYTAVSTSEGSRATSHAVDIAGLMPNTLYYYQVKSVGEDGAVATSTARMFKTATSTVFDRLSPANRELRAIAQIIEQLRQKIIVLQQLIHEQLNSGASTLPAIPNTGARAGSNMGTSTSDFSRDMNATRSMNEPPLYSNNPYSRWPLYTPTGPAAIDEDGRNVRAGSSIDMSGANFGREEDVAVMMAGQRIKMVHADGGGNFSTGSMSVPMMPGMYTYTFIGQESGRVATATITVTLGEEPN